jgi:FAD/FMN-containing dehydrogenase
VEVDAGAGIAFAGGRATARDLIDAGRPHGLVTATGSVGKVGMAGLTLAGGYGPLDGRYGLTLDNLVSADVVLADGRQVTASEGDDAELLWALRGGGANFGVLTDARYRLHPVASVLAGLVLYPLSDAAAVLNGYASMFPTAPDELSVASGFIGTPQGPVLFLSPLWSGEPAAGKLLLAEVLRLGTPLSAQVSLVPYADVLGLQDRYAPDGRHYWMQTRWLPAMTEAAVDVLINAAAGLTSPFLALNIKPFHGAAARVPGEATAFALRRDHVLVEIIGAWEPASVPAADGNRHVDWARRTDAELAPLARPGGSPNLLAPDARDRTRLAYGRNATRLLQLERRYDPDAVFTSAVGIASSVPSPLPGTGEH